MEINQRQVHYPMLDILRFAGAVMVILIHCGRLTENPVAHFIIKSMICRCAVPIFLISTGYFIHEKEKTDLQYLRSYFRRNLKDYLFWSMIYLPYGILFIMNLHVFGPLYLPALLGGLAYTGVCYHLWYYPAMFLGIFFVKWALRRFSYLKTFPIAFLLYSFGSCETYAGYLSGTFLGNIYNSYRSIFFTTRNGLFFSFIFVLLGFYLSETRKQPLFQRRLGLKLLGSCLLFCVEGLIVYRQPGDDKNFFFSLIPLSVFLGAFCLRSTRLKGIEFTGLRSMGKYLFLMHLIFLEGIKWLGKASGLGVIQVLPLFATTFTCTLGAALVVQKVKHLRQPQGSRGSNCLQFTLLSSIWKTERSTSPK